MRNGLLPAGTLILWVASLGGCGPSPDRPAELRAADLLPSVAPASAILKSGTTLRIVGRGLGKGARWTSSQPLVATVDSITGLVNALAAGRTEIRLRLDTVVRYVPVRVVEEHPAGGRLFVDSLTPRYFVDARGRPVYLTGSHTWPNFQDGGEGDPPNPFDYGAYLDFLQAHNHNFTRLWVWEQASWATEVPGRYHVTPVPWERTGPGRALDGQPRFDLTRFNEAYFARLRARALEAGRRGIYVSVMLFNGWSVAAMGRPGNPWKGHPLHRSNNVNGIDGDPDGDGRGIETHTLDLPPVTAVQEAYVRKVVDAVGDLDNVLFEISNESDPRSTAWQYHLIALIRDYERKKGSQHPVGMSVTFPGGSNADLLASSADWISPRRTSDDPFEPFPAFTSKIVLHDTDHLCGICGSVSWVWRSLARGLNPVLMDGYDGRATGIGDATYDPADPVWEEVRRNLGYARVLAEGMNLASARPRPDLASTGYCLAALGRNSAEYLIYSTGDADLTVDLTDTWGTVGVEWFEPATGRTVPGRAEVGGGIRRFAPPEHGDIVLLLTATRRAPEAPRDGSQPGPR